MDLIEHAFVLLQTKAFPVYLRNIDKREPPFAHGEFVPCAIAVLLISSGLDYHLARLKYLRDISVHKPSLPHTPYFNWDVGESLSGKLGKLLIKRGEKRLREQLIAMTIMRDSVAHPKVYLVREMLKPDLGPANSKAKLAAGTHMDKARRRKLKRSERTKTLQLPLVPTWISYPDVVVCALVLNRFLNLLERKYGNPYAWVGGFSVRNDPPGFFNDWGDRTRRSISMNDWAKGLFDSLSSNDQQKVRKRLGSGVSLYFHKQKPQYKKGKGGIIDALRYLQNPPSPEFLRKPPPWPN